MRGSARRKLGELIKRLRRSQNMSQQALALALGVHEHTVARWERDGIDPRHAALPQIVAALAQLIRESQGRVVDPSLVVYSYADADHHALRLATLVRVLAAYRAGLPSPPQA